jgi:FkbM family methyltransferase
MDHYEQELEELLSKPKSYYFDKMVEQYGPFDPSKINEVILFGSGLQTPGYIDACRKSGITVLGIADNNKDKNGTRVDGVEIISIDRLGAHPLDTPIIVITLHETVVIAQLRTLGFRNIWGYMFVSSFYPDVFPAPFWPNPTEHTLAHKEQVMEGFRLYEDEVSQKTYVALVKHRLTLDGDCIKNLYRPIESQYFDPELIKLSKHEAFVDGGAYSGDSLQKFLRYAGGEFDAIYSFEPNPGPFAQLKETVKRSGKGNILLYQDALGEEESVLKFRSDRYQAARLSEEGDIAIDVVALDKILAGKKVTFIKLDIEGAELAALKGSERIIKDQKPTLTICLYHKLEDLWEIPAYIKSTGCYGRLYIRKYDDTLLDIICYAIPH